MKNEEIGKFFKRKTTSLKLLICEQKSEKQLGCVETTSKFLSPKNVKGLDSTTYKKEESLVRTLQQEVNKLKHEVTRLKHKNLSLEDQNMVLKKEIEKNNEAQRKSQNKYFATVNVLNELREKIDLLNEDDQLSTYDEIEMEDVCRCQQYESQVKEFREKVKFLEDSLLHSQEIIMRLNEEIKKLKFSKIDQQNHLKTNKKSDQHKQNLFRSPSPKHKSNRTSKSKYKCNSIEEILEDHEE